MLLLGAAAPLAAETLQMITYYPPPDPPIDRFHAQRTTIGPPYTLNNPTAANLPDGTLRVAGWLGIGTEAAPLSSLQIATDLDGDRNDATLDAANDDFSGGAEFLTRRSRGTLTSRATVVNGDDLGGVKFHGFHSGDYVTSIAFSPMVDGVPSAGSVPTLLYVWSYIYGELFRITADGRIGIKTPAPASTLEVVGSVGMATTEVTGSVVLDSTHGMVACDNSSNIIAALPPAALSLRRTHTIKKISSNSATVTIDGNGAAIDGNPTLVLYVPGDTVQLLCDGTSWHVLEQRLVPHKALLVQDGQQNLNNPSQDYPITFDSEAYDQGGLANPAAAAITIRRDGFYLVSASLHADPITAGETLSIQVQRNGTKVLLGYNNSGSASGRLGTRCSDVLYLVQGDEVTLTAWHRSSAAAQTVVSSPDLKARLSVVELRR